MSINELAAAMRGCDAIIFSAGAGGKDSDEATTHIDGDGPGKLAAAAERVGVRRFVLVSVFPEAWRERPMDASFEHYMLEKKKAETSLVLTNLDWLVVRPSALTDEPGTGLVDLGLAKLHVEVPRDDVATTIVGLLRAPKLNRSPMFAAAFALLQSHIEQRLKSPEDGVGTSASWRAKLRILWTMHRRLLPILLSRLNVWPEVQWGSDLCGAVHAVPERCDLQLLSVVSPRCSRLHASDGVPGGRCLLPQFDRR